MKLPEGATLDNGELAKVEAAMEALANDVHAPRQISVNINLHVFRAYPKVVGDKVFNSAEEEEAAKPKEKK